MKTPQLDSSVDSSKKKNKNQTLNNNELEKSRKQDIIASPLNGEVKNLSKVNDEVFSSGSMGKGIVIVPKKGIVYAPTNATISMVFKTGHAIGLTTELGTEILIHIGLDTVELKGEGFEKLVQEGDEVLAGQPLIIFEIDKLQQKGYEIDIPIVISNISENADIFITDEKQLEHGDYLFTVVNS
ncbi:PTS glucose transporter subunit IIA [Tetragenococcus halophilus]